MKRKGEDRRIRMEARARWKESNDGKGRRRSKINNFTFCGHSSIVGPTEYK